MNISNQEQKSIIIVDKLARDGIILEHTGYSGVNLT